MIQTPLTKAVRRVVARAIAIKAPVLGVVDPLVSMIQRAFGSSGGVFFVPKPVMLGQQVLFQDAAGSVPVTQSSDPVGLMLDLSRGLELGDEALPAFDLTQWDTGGVYDLEDVTANAFTHQATVAISTSLPVTTGATYRVEIDIDHTASAAIRAYFSDTAANLTTAPVLGEDTGGLKNVFYLPCYGPHLTFRLSVGNGRATINKLSVRELKGNHAIQEDDEARLTYSTDNGRDELVSDGSTTYMTTRTLTLSEDWFSGWAGEVTEYYDFGGIWRLMRIGGDPTAWSDNRLEEYFGADKRRYLIQRYEGQTANSTRKEVMPAAGTEMVAWANRSPGEEIAQGESYPDSPYELVEQELPSSPGTATFYVAQGYKGQILNGRIAGLIFIPRGVTVAQRQELTGYLSGLVGEGPETLEVTP